MRSRRGTASALSSASTTASFGTKHTVIQALVYRAKWRIPTSATRIRTANHILTASSTSSGPSRTHLRPRQLDYRSRRERRVLGLAERTRLDRRRRARLRIRQASHRFLHRRHRRHRLPLLHLLHLLHRRRTLFLFSLIADTWPGASGWTGSTQTVTTCGSYGSIVGGANVWGQGSVSSEDAQTCRHIHRCACALSTMRSTRGRAGSLRVDNSLVWDQAYNGGMQSIPGMVARSNQCGSGTQDAKFEIERIIAHSSSSVTLRFSSTLNEGASNEAWGMQNVRVNLDVLAPPPPPYPPGRASGPPPPPPFDCLHDARQRWHHPFSDEAPKNDCLHRSYIDRRRRSQRYMLVRFPNARQYDAKSRSSRPVAVGSGCSEPASQTRAMHRHRLDDDEDALRLRRQHFNHIVEAFMRTRQACR